jgi:hypothetical protein
LIRIPAHIPGLCGTRSNGTVCKETNLSHLEGVCDAKSHLPNFGGTGVSRPSAEFLTREPDSKARDSSNGTFADRVVADDATFGGLVAT